MTIEVVQTEKTVNGNGVTTIFGFDPIPIFDRAHIKVTKIDGIGVETLLVQVSEGDINDTAYYVTITDPLILPSVGSVVYPASGALRLQTGESLFIQRILPITQETNLENRGGYFPEVQEKAFDEGIMIDQQLQTQITQLFADFLAGTVPDGDYGDVVVSGGGTIWTVTAGGGGLSHPQIMARISVRV